MRILVVIDSLVPAGAERSLVQTAPLLVDRNVDLRIAMLHDRPGLQDELIENGIEVDSLGAGGRLGWLKSLSELIDEVRPDLVHTTLFEAGLVGRLAARRRGVPVITTMASEPYGSALLDNPAVSRAKLRMAQAAEIATLRLAVRVHAVSEPVASTTAARLRYPRDRIDVVPRGRDPQWLGRRTDVRRRQARKSLGVEDSQTVSLTVARHAFSKGIDVLVDAAPSILASMPGTVFLLAGRRTAHTAEIEDRIAALGLEQSFRLLGERSDIPELLTAADLFVLPTRREGFPGAIVEAMAMEVPVLASGIPEVRSVVDESTAVLVPVDDVGALASGAVEAVSGAGRNGRVENARREFEQSLTLGPVADAMVALYRRAIDQSS